MRIAQVAIVDRAMGDKLLRILISVSLIGFVACEPRTQTTTTTTTATGATTKVDRLLQKRSHDKDFAPKLIHQPHSVSVQPNKPHTSECPVESQPESDVKWFKDNKLLEDEPMHLEQTGSELMFFLVNDRDTGDYHCEATNYLGTVTSEQFRLTVQSSVLDESIQLEPRVYVAAELQEQPAEFKCTLPMVYLAAGKSAAAAAGARRRTARLPDIVSWRKNGKRLHQVVWTDAAGSAQDESAPAAPPADGDEAAHGRQPRFTARQGDRQNEFVLSVARVTRSRDDNSTFTCLFRPDGEPAESDSGGPEVMAHESKPALLRVESVARQAKEPVKLNIPMGQPIDFSSSSSSSGGDAPPTTALDQQQITTNHTTQLHETIANNGNQQPKRIRTSLSETLADLYEIAKPTILIFGAFCLVAVLVLVQLLFARRRAQVNRYMKHHHHQYSSASSSSANSNNGAGSGASSATLGADPVLSSLLSRTLAAPSASSLSVNAGKKYKLYRDHMRKVAAAITNDHQLVEGADFIDASAYFNQQQQEQMLASQLFAAGAPLPNLYNQSLAAREQARSLLLQANGAGEHMRSLGNLNAAAAAVGQQQSFNQQQQQQQKSFAHLTRDLNSAGHTLELPLNFALNGHTSSSSSSSYGARHEAGPLEAGAANLIPASNQMAFNQFVPNQFATARPQQQQQQQQQPLQQQPHQLGPDEHYQLVSCSSISPSSTSSIVGGSTNSSSNKHCDRAPTATTTNREMGAPKVRESVSSNHYSTIDANDEEEEDRYEELDERSSSGCRSFARGSARSSTSSGGNNQRNKQHFQRNKSTFVGGKSCDANQPARLRSSLISSRSSDSACTLSADAFARNFSSRRQNQRANGSFAAHDQLSPYAVSSISNNAGGGPNLSLQQQQPKAQRRELAPPAATQPPPVTSEAMQALNEQLDINHLLTFDQHEHAQQGEQAAQYQQHSSAATTPPRLPFSLPPPPSSAAAEAKQSTHETD